VAEKAQFIVSLALFMACVEGGVVENVIWGRGLTEKSEYRHIRGGV